MSKSNTYHTVSDGIPTLGSVLPVQLAESTTLALEKLRSALGDDVSGYVANRLHLTKEELGFALAAEQVDGVALAMYNIESRSQSVIIGDQTGIGKGRQAAAMIRYGLLSGYLPIFFTERYTLFSDMYRDCKALGIKEARPLVVNAGASVVDFDIIIDDAEDEMEDEIWSPKSEDDSMPEEEQMRLYQKQYEVVYKAPKKNVLQELVASGDIPSEAYDYLMVTYSQLKDSKKDRARLDFLHSLCEKHRVLFIFDEAHRSSSVSAGKVSVITQSINLILEETPTTQCVFLSATFAKRPESLITFMRRTALNALATEDTLEQALHSGGVPMQEYVSTTLAGEGQMIRREHSNEGLPAPVYTYLDDDIVLHGEQFDKVMYFFREIVKFSNLVQSLVNQAQMRGFLTDYKCYPTRSQLFYINKVLLLSLKAKKVAEAAICEVKQGRSVVIGMSDTLECVLRDVMVRDDGTVRGDFSALLLRLLEKTVRSSSEEGDRSTPIYDMIQDSGDFDVVLLEMADEVWENYKYIAQSIKEEVFHLPMSPIDVIRQLITSEQFVAPDDTYTAIRFEECTGRAHQLEYLSPEGADDYVNARILPRRKRHTNHIFNDFQNNKIDVILINACGAIGASAHAVATAEVPDDKVRQRKMLIVQNDLDVNIDLQKRGRINRTGQRKDLPPLYEYIISAIPSEKRLNMMLRAKLRSLSANTAACQDQEKELADFIDIDNKYGDAVTREYLEEHPELQLVLGLKGKARASQLMARIAMLSVTAQQDIVDDIMAAYTSLEAELRRINQWDLEREFRDFEAEFVREELFTSAVSDNQLGGSSYLTTYRCKQKTFPHPFKELEQMCKEASTRFGEAYPNNPSLQKEVKDYFLQQNKTIRQRFKERQELLYANAERILTNYCGDASLVVQWLLEAAVPYESWNAKAFLDVELQKRAKQIKRKLISYSNEHNHLLKREKEELKKTADEKKRLIEVLSMAKIGNGYVNIRSQIESEDSPDMVKAVLIDIRFGKGNQKRFLPSRVEFVFALSAVFTEVRINMVHNNKWSNYQRLVDIFSSREWYPSAGVWDGEIAHNNSKVVERKIITGNILGAYVHPGLDKLKPRFITFSLAENADANSPAQNGLLLSMNESAIREALQNVTLPLHEGLRHATNPNTSYTIAGLDVRFALLPLWGRDDILFFGISVDDHDSKDFETNKQYDAIRPLFRATEVRSIYDKYEEVHSHKKPMHYQLSPMRFDSQEFQSVITLLASLNAVITVPRSQITVGEMKELQSQSQKEISEPWPVLDWRSADAVPMPPVRQKLIVRIEAPKPPRKQNGKAVFRHSELYLLAEETKAKKGLPLQYRSTLDALRLCYFKWLQLNEDKSTNYQLDCYYQRAMVRHLRDLIENHAKQPSVTFPANLEDMLQAILDSEHLNANGLYMVQFEREMLFLSPREDDAQIFLESLPCSDELAGIRKCIEDYLDGKTDIINSPDRF